MRELANHLLQVAPSPHGIILQGYCFHIVFPFSRIVTIDATYVYSSRIGVGRLCKVPADGHCDNAELPEACLETAKARCCKSALFLVSKAF